MKIDDYSKNMMLSTNEIQIEKEYWHKQLDGEAFLSGFANDIGSGCQNDGGFSTSHYRFPDEVSKKIISLGNRSLYAVFMILLSGVDYLLYRYNGNEDIIVGMPAFKQKKEGVFVNNILFLRSRIDADSQYKTFLTGIKETVLEADKYQNYPFEKNAQLLNIQKSNGYYQIPAIVLMDNIHDKECMDGVRTDITICFSMEENSIRFEIRYNEEMFEEQFIDNIASHLTCFLEAAAGNAGIRLSDIDILSGEERITLLNDFNDTQLAYDSNMTIHRLFEEQVKNSPDKTAIVFENVKMTYSELNEKANRLAGFLRGQQGFGLETPVGILMERSENLIVAMIGILKAGGVYVPIDAKCPEDRLKNIINKAGIEVIVSSKRFVETLNRVQPDCDTFNSYICMDGEDIFSEKENEQNQPGSGEQHKNRYDAKALKKYTIQDYKVSPDNLAYIIFTSGSTGEPKGVMIEHRSVINFISAVTHRIGSFEGKSILAVTSVSFDIFVLETLLPLSKGMKIVIANEIQQTDSKQLVELIEKSGVNILQTTPSRMKMLLNSDEKNCLGKLDIIMVGGEALSEPLADNLKRLAGPKLYNMYGPTETTVWSSIWEVSESEKISIGRPVANTQMYIVNKHNELQPVGVAGELCISGDGLARGYLNNPELTELKFVKNPYLAAGKMYKTGDMAKWLPDGNIDFLGRIDHQVKFRGYRIELSEIENTLLRYGKIKEVVIRTKENDTVGSYICAYYVSEEQIPVSELREYLSRKLPDYMIPSYFVSLDKIPLTPNGKLDGKSLPEPSNEVESGEEYVAPSNDIQKSLTDIWQEVLGLQKVGINDNFFNIGGNSILLIKLHSKIDELYPGKLTAIDIFTYTTVKKLADFIERANKFEYITSFEYVVLPEEYFFESDTNENKSDFEFFIDETTFDKVKEISNKDSAGVFDILVSLYTQLFYELSGSTNISIHTMISGIDEVIPIKVDLEQADSFADIIGSVKRELIANTAYKYGLKDLGEINVVKKDKAVIPFFYREDLCLERKVELLDSYDIVFSVKEADSKIRFVCKYDAGRLRSEGIVKLINAYLKLFDFLIGEYA